MSHNRMLRQIYYFYIIESIASADMLFLAGDILSPIVYSFNIFSGYFLTGDILSP